MAVRKGGAGKGPGKKAARKKTASRKAAAKKAAARTKAVAKKAPVKKAAAKKSSTKKATAKKAVANKAPARKAAASKARRGVAKKAAARKTAARKASVKSSARKGAAKKPATRKPATAKTAPKKPAAKKVAPPKAAAGKPATGTRGKAASKKTARKTAARLAAREPITATPRKRKPRAAPAPTPAVATPAPVPVRKPARAPARRTPPHRASTPREKAARKEAVRTAIGGAQTARRLKPAASGKATPPIAISGDETPHKTALLTPDALEFLATLHAQFDARRHRLLVRRLERQARFDAGDLPDFLHETRHVRASGWRVGALAPLLLDRRVEISGPPTETFVAAAAHSGALACVLYFEAAPPGWPANLQAHSLAVTVCGQGDGPVIVIAPRNWHSPEPGLHVGEAPLSAALFDFGLSAVHAVPALIAKGRPPAFCLSRLESHLEARLWSDVLVFTEKRLGLERGTLKVTVLVDTLPALFEMDEIVFELREHIVGLALDRRDLLGSFVRRVGRQPRFLTPDLQAMADSLALLAEASRLLVTTCHRRGVLALADATPLTSRGSAIPAIAERAAQAAQAGFDGLRLTDPSQAGPALEAFARLVPQANQLERPAAGPPVTREELLRLPEGPRTRAGLESLIASCAEALLDLLAGRDSADCREAELARALVWQWLVLEAPLADGTAVTPGLFGSVLAAALARQQAKLGGNAHETRLFELTASALTELVEAPDCEEFLRNAASRIRDS